MEHVVAMNMATLIATVERFPCVWDPTHEEYKNKFDKRRAWKAICSTVINDFDELDHSSQMVAERAIKTRWANVRDYFIKSAKMEANTSPTERILKKKYTYYDLLLFLKKTISSENTYSSNELMKTETLTQDPSNVDSLPNSNTTKTPSCRKSNKRNHSDQQVQSQSESSETIKLPKDEDAAFLESILPSIKRIDEDKKLGFRIELLQLLQKYSEESRSTQAATQPRCYAKTYLKPTRVENNIDSPNKRVCSEQNMYETVVVKIDSQVEPEPTLFETSFANYSEVSD